MNTVTVRASRQYDILIGQGLLPTLGAEAKKLGKAQKVCVISETTVYPLYGAVAEESLKSAGFSVVSYVFPAGEESKNGLIFLDLLNFLAENQLTRSDLIVALGGGVVGDLAGFAAASYLRGIRFIQVPTTLLAAVDSSVGGKTAIDLPAGKNLAGAFCQPSLVLCDTDTLNSLPLDIFRDGCAEVIKYGVLYDPKLFAHLEEKGLSFDREAVITRCVELKRDVVMEDEFDTGARMKLIWVTPSVTAWRPKAILPSPTARPSPLAWPSSAGHSPAPIRRESWRFWNNSVCPPGRTTPQTTFSPTPSRTRSVPAAR